MISNNAIRTFRNSIVAFCNESELPVEVKYLALKDITAQLEKHADQAVLMETNRVTLETEKKPSNQSENH